MSAVSFQSLLAGPRAESTVRLWRRTFDVNDPTADVGRPWGDGSPRQGNIVRDTIIETAKKWFKDANAEAQKAYADALAKSAGDGSVASAPSRPKRMKWNPLATLEAVFSFVDFKSGECIATYEMIADAAHCARDTVYKHLNILRDLGLISWVRRCEATGNKEGQRTKAAPNSYYFEITRLPSRVQMMMRQILKKRGVELAAHPERACSGRVPNRAQRLASRLGKSLSGVAGMMRGRKNRDDKVSEAAFVRSETELMGDIPTAQWASIRYPGDVAAQAAYNARLGILSFDHESPKLSLHSPATEPKEKE